MMIYMAIILLALTSIMRIHIQPLFITIILLMMTLNISLMCGTMLSSWFAFILMLIYVGGMLVMFFYIITISPNSFLKFSKIKDMLFIIFFISILFFSVNNNKFNQIHWTMFLMKNIKLNSTISIMLMSNKFLYIMLTILLLLIMITVVKLCHKKSSSMRLFEN